MHEAYVRIAQGSSDFRSRTHFQALAAVAMRHVLVDHVRGKKRDKRGGDWERITLSALPGFEDERTVDLEELEAALEALRAMDERGARTVELRFFGGMTDKEVAEELHVSERTVRNDWSMARAWLRVRLGGDDAASSTRSQTGS